MSDNVATLEPTQQTEAQPTQEQVVQAPPETSQIMAESLWGMQQTPYQSVQPQEPAAVAPPAETPAIPTTEAQPAPTPDKEEVLDVNDYFKREFGLEINDFRTKWDELNKPKEVIQPQEQKWSYDDSKEDEIYNYIHQKKQLEKLEKYDVADATQAGEILRANLQFKYKDTLSQQEIDRLYSKQYSLPNKPAQTLDQTDEDYAETVQAWESQVKERQMDMIIEAKMMKPELAKLKSQIVPPDIQKPQMQQEGPSQEELAAMEAGRKAYLGAIESNFQNFKGFTVTAKDGEVQMPISYAVNQDEVNASKQTLENFNVNEFFGTRWFDEKGTPNVTLMQEDLYLLANRDKIFQKIATEAFTQMKAHMIKSQNNINLNGVNQTLGPVAPSQQAPKNESQLVAERIWAI